MRKFEQKVFKGLQNCGLNLNSISHLKLGVAVSGGADSVALLVSLVNLSINYNFSLYVISVNHNIRSADESGGDAEYVARLCEKLHGDGKNISCSIKEILPGVVKDTSSKRGQGIEDAARFLRYQLFEDFIHEYNLDFLCLAHNKNDQLETLIMRFLQGADCDSSGGISHIRGKYIRPLIDIERSEIEEYLKSKEIVWRTDSTNFDTDYLRNKIRHKLIPVLDEEFSGWKKAVIAGGKKAVLQNEVIETFQNNIEYENIDGKIKISIETIRSLPKTVSIRLITKFMNLMGELKRIPYVFLEEVVNSINNLDSDFSKVFDIVTIECKKGYVFIKKIEKSQTDLVFFDIIEESGLFSFPFGNMEVLVSDNAKASVIINERISIKEIPVPFVVRNIQIDDEIECSDGTMKKISDIMADWRIDDGDKDKIPILQLLKEKNQPVKMILGSIFGYKDWIVK